MASEDTNSKPVTENGKITYAIWDYSNSLTDPNKALNVEFQHKQWQALVAVSLIPGFINRESTTPLFFSDSSSDISTVIPYDTKKVTTWGSDAKTASAKIATEYWSKAELVFIVDNYEQALWVVPSASFYKAPILVTPAQDTLNSLDTKCAVIVGNSNLDVENSIKLSNKNDVWKFQLMLFRTQGVECNYIIITNPRDTEDTTPKNIKWTFQSPAAGLLAAYRGALVQTGDWSIDRQAFEAVETATDPDDTNYNKIKPGFTKLKEDSYDVEKLLQDNGHQPEYLAAVGGPYAVPNYVYDIHVDYYWPTSNPQKTQYPSSLAPYATISESVAEDAYTKEDLAAGRLAAGNIFDLTKQLVRTFFYREYLPGGSYYSSTPAGWEKKASFADGHRLNQPEPDSLDWNADTPYYPYEGVNPAYINAGLTVNYYLPRNESDPYDTNMTIEKIMESTTNTGFLHFMPHGGLTNLRIEVGVDNVTGRQNVFLEASTINELNYKAPTMIYTTCCKGGVWMLDSGYEPSDFITSSFIHAGAVAYLATPEIQSACFWKDAPFSVSGDQAIKFWENIFSGNIPIGKALRDAKWTAHETWEAKTPKPTSPKTHHADCISYTLFGDPALELYKPKVQYKDESEFEIKVNVDELIAEEDFTLTISVLNVETNAELTDATLKVTFEGTEKTGSSVTFTAPKDAGEYQLSVEVTKTGYRTANADAWVSIQESEDENGDGKGFIPGFTSIFVVIAVAVTLLIAIYIEMKRIE
jgi:hypothetical protein